MIQSVSRALDILTIVSDAKGKPIKLNAIAEKAGLNGSTCTHLVQTLCEKGFLSQVSRSAGYVLGAYPYYLTRYRTFQRELINTCNPALRWIQRRTGHTAILAILVDVEKFVISYAEDGKDILHERGDLYRGNLYDSATGRAMLSAMRHTDLTQLVKKIGLPSEADWPGIAARLRKSGFDGPLTFELNRTSRPGRHENDAYAALPLRDYVAEALNRARRFAALFEEAPSASH